MEGFLGLTQIVHGLECAMEDGDVEHVKDVSEDGVLAALQQMLARQRNGEALGVLRRRVGGTWMYRIEPPDEATAEARAGRRTLTVGRLQAVLLAMLDAETVVEATTATTQLIDAAGDELVSLGPLLEALATIGDMPLACQSSPLDTQLLLTAADDVLSDAEVCVVERMSRAQPMPGARRKKLSPTRNSPAQPKRRRSARGDAAAASAREHDAQLSGELVELVSLLLTEATRRLLADRADADALTFLRDERRQLTAFACAELTLLQQGRARDRKRLQGFAPPAIRAGMRALQGALPVADRRGPGARVRRRRLHRQMHARRERGDAPVAQLCDLWLRGGRRPRLARQVLALALCAGCTFPHRASKGAALAHASWIAVRRNARAARRHTPRGSPACCRWPHPLPRHGRQTHR